MWVCCDSKGAAIGTAEVDAKPLSSYAIGKIFATFRARNPFPTTDLKFANHYQLLVAVVLSAQTTDVAVNKATSALFREVQTPGQMLDFGGERFEAAIRTVGLYRTKARNIMKLSSILIERFDAKVPDNREALLTFPGVGRKTANVVLNTAFGYPTMAVDTHVFRTAARIGLACGRNVDETEKLLVERIPKKYLLNAHHWLILHGRYTCIARQPKCQRCAINQWCRYFSLRKATHR